MDQIKELLRHIFQTQTGTPERQQAVIELDRLANQLIETEHETR